ncbi:MAG: ATP-binding cassette domain-containing protein, partial [Planctomycetota bacterium]
MSIVTFQDVHKSYGPEVVFDRLSLQFYANQKIGLIGANGSGKTTLFKLVLGDEQPDTGKIICAKNTKIGYLPQEPIFDGNRTVIEEMHEGLADILNLDCKITDFA